jgi:peptide/nickel transport system ATP-binding protein/oligopeptide transport system ATP-binding protein
MLLNVENLATYFFLDEGILRAVDDLSLTVEEQETVTLVGESGCGKTIVALSIMNLVPPPGRIVEGKVLFNGEDLLRVSRERLRQIRGGAIGLVFQEPGAALNPVFTVGHQISEVLQLHRGMTKREAESEAIRLLGDTGIPDPEKRYRAYPFELSGGMRQRAVIAIATCTRPKLLIADEPTTALDVTVQADILDLLRYLQDRYRMAILMISHDLGVVAGIADRVLVMYTGKAMELAGVRDIFREPKHPYSRGLLASIPRLGEGRGKLRRGIPGAVPDLLRLPQGCTFHPRCPIGDTSCQLEFPPLRALSNERLCACYKVNG